MDTTGTIGDLPISKDCNRSHVCRLWPLDGKYPKCLTFCNYHLRFIYFCYDNVLYLIIGLQKTLLVVGII